MKLQATFLALFVAAAAAATTPKPDCRMVGGCPDFTGGAVAQPTTSSTLRPDCRMVGGCPDFTAAGGGVVKPTTTATRPPSTLRPDCRMVGGCPDFTGGIVYPPGGGGAGTVMHPTGELTDSVTGSFQRPTGTTAPTRTTKAPGVTMNRPTTLKTSRGKQAKTTRTLTLDCYMVGGCPSFRRTMTTTVY